MKVGAQAGTFISEEHGAKVSVETLGNAIHSGKESILLMVSVSNLLLSSRRQVKLFPLSQPLRFKRLSVWKLCLLTLLFWSAVDLASSSRQFRRHSRA